MARFLQNFGTSLPNATQISEKLFQYVTRIDENITKLTMAAQIPPIMAPVQIPLPQTIHQQHQQQHYHHQQQHAAVMSPPHMVPLTQMMTAPAPAPAPVVMAPPQQHYTFDGGGFYQLPVNFMGNMFSTAFSGTDEGIDWSILDDLGYKTDAALS